MIDELVATAELGEEAKNFLASDLGRCLLGLAQQEAALASEKLETVDAKDSEQVRQLQYQVKFGRSFEGWLKSLVADGDNALAAWKQQRE